jgi:hypothetical protein
VSKRGRLSREATDIPDEDIVILDADGAVAPEPGRDVALTMPEPRQKGSELIPPKRENEPEPLDVLRRELEEHKTARAEAERKLNAEKAERERANTDHATSKLAQDKLVIEQAYTAAEGRAVQAKRAFADAMKAGDYNAAAEAQAAIARTENEMSRYADAYQIIEERSKAPPALAAAEDNSLDAQIARIPDASVRQWATAHKDDLADPARLKLAYAADNLAVARGLQPGTDAYLDFMDEQLGYEMEDESPPPPPRRVAPAPAPTRRRAPAVAAPVSRGSGGKVSVTLTDADKAFAQQLGMTHKDYARSVLAAKNDPRFDKYSNRSR